MSTVSITDFKPVYSESSSVTPGLYSSNALLICSSTNDNSSSRLIFSASMSCDVLSLFMSPSLEPDTFSSAVSLPLSLPAVSSVPISALLSSSDVSLSISE